MSFLLLKLALTLMFPGAVCIACSALVSASKHSRWEGRLVAIGASLMVAAFLLFWAGVLIRLWGLG